MTILKRFSFCVILQMIINFILTQLDITDQKFFIRRYFDVYDWQLEHFCFLRSGGFPYPRMQVAQGNS